MRRFFLIAAICCVAGLPLAADTIVYDQPATYIGPDGIAHSVYTNTFVSGNSGYRTLDNFSLGSTGAIASAQWTEFVWDYVNSADNPVTPTVNSWDIAFYADNNGLPGAQTYDTVEPASSVTATLLGTLIINGPTVVNVYQFDASLPSPFVADAGTTYWFSPEALQTSTDTVEGWLDGTGGNNHSVQQTLDGTGMVTATTVHTGDRAFTLVATPEPGTVVLMGTVLVALGCFRRRRA